MGKKRFVAIYKDFSDETQAKKGSVKYSNIYKVCKYKGCFTILNGYTVGRKGKYCFAHQSKINQEKRTKAIYTDSKQNKK